MATVSSGYVSSKALMDLQTELKQLSENIMEVYDLINQNVVSVHEDWDDEKFEEFYEDFKPKNELIFDLSEKYMEWANNYLPPRIELAIKYEKAKTGIK